MIDLRLKRKMFNDAYFDDIYDYSNRYTVYYGGAGSGKSHAIVQKLIIKALGDRRKILVMRKVGTTIRESTWRMFTDILSSWRILSACRVRESTYEISFPNGSQVLFYGLDDPEKIKSIAGITDIWVEEATEFMPEDIQQLDLRLRAKADGLQMIFSFNPISKANWVYKRWFESGAADGAKIIRTTYKDNRFLPDAYIKTLESMITTSPAYYRIYALGEFASLDKLVFTNWTVDTISAEDIRTGTLICGLDFGFVADTTAFICATVLDNCIKVFREWGTTGVTNAEIASAIKALGFSKSRIVCDSAEPKSIEELKRCGLTRVQASVKGKDSVIHGIQRMQQYRIIIDPSCTQTITELQNYAWRKDRKTGDYINEPIDAFNHFLDALRYALQIVGTKSLRMTNKTLLGL